MEKSLFKQYVDNWFGPLVKKVVEKVNGDKNPLVYLHKRMLRKEFSTSLKWGSLTSNGTAVAADVVALNSSLPLKKRDSIQKAEGDIPKLGMKLYLDEKTLTELDILEAQNADGSRTQQILKKLFEDAKKCIVGVDEQLEAMFLQALSTGITLIEDEKNTGAAIRIDFKHPDSNKFGVTKKWSDPDAKPLDDLENVMDEAEKKGYSFTKIMMDRATFNNFRTKADVKDLYAAGFGIAGANVPTPTLSQINTVLEDNYEITIEVVNRSVTYEKNGKRTSVKPFATNTVVFLTGDQVGTLTWGRLAEMNHPVKNVDYQVVDEFKLISKYHKIDPLQEYTSSQALVVPVIDDVDSIYIMSTEEATAAEDAQTEGDAVYTYKGTNYTLQSVVDGLNATNEVPEATTTQKDATLAKKIDSLSEEGVATFESKLVESV